MRLAVLVSAVGALAALLYGAGHAGDSSVAVAAEGVFGQPTLVTPHSAAFGIWSLIYLGLIVCALWQVLPAQRSYPRVERARALMAAAMILNAVWVFVVLHGWVLLSVAVIAVLFAVLVALLDRLAESCPETRAEVIVMDGTFGLYAGWLCVSVFANVAVWLQSLGVTAGATAWSLIVLALAATAGIALMVLARVWLPVLAGLVWAFGWIAYARASGDVHSTVTAIAAGAAGALVVGAAVVQVLPRRMSGGPKLIPRRRGGHHASRQ